MTQRPLHILVLCTGNSARSILAEALFRHLGAGRVVAFSAGSHPTGRVNPLALQLLAETGLSVDGYRSKSWDEFAAPGAPPLDVVITVCDSAAGETCPIWPGRPITAHWGVPDPAAVEGDEAKKIAAFRAAHERLAARVRAMLALPLDGLAREALADKLKTIGTL